VGPIDYKKIIEKRPSSRDIRFVFFPKNIDAFRERLLDVKNKEVLDFGCGYKRRFYDWCKGNAKTYKGYDIDRETVKWLKKDGLFFDFYKENKKFDLIYCSQVFEHLTEKERYEFLKRSKRLLRKGGATLIDFPNFETLHALEYFRDGTHKLPPSIYDLKSFLELEGFKVDAYFVGWSLHPFRVIRNIFNILMGFKIQEYCLIKAKKIK